VGTLSGPIGSTVLSSVQAVQVWVKAINARGGLNGHLVNLVVFDDGGDPARHRAQVQEAVEQRHAIAFLQQNGTISGHSSVAYIERKRVPVIGSETGSPWFYTSPMFFPQTTSGDGLYYSILASAARQNVPNGRTKLGSLVCVEVQGCKDSERVFTAFSSEVKFAYVYKGRASLAQPDYTAECLSARNAGVQVLIVFLDPNSITRLGSSCRRQGVHVVLGLPSLLVTADRPTDPNADGAVGASGVFPWFQSGTPATDEFHRAIKTYGQNITLGTGPPTGWVSGKVLEKAAANLPEPPTSDAILHGLWSLKGETLGGLTSPLSFAEGKPAPRTACWFNLLIKDRSWVSPDHFKLNCRDGEMPA
ncbi:MAG TPA: ABC transporter substrate-binding protein, partial [Acidimicrobiia bacterium]|nr:ABC transporter substrate-binding protein [Acidimicrobiia bacterium]